MRLFGSELSCRQADGRADRHDAANTAFRNFTNALEVHKMLRLGERISLCPQSKK